MIPNSGIIKLKIFDILGNEVDELYSGYKNAGLHSLTFNGSNLASGVYFYQLQFENSIITKKLLLLK